MCCDDLRTAMRRGIVESTSHIGVVAIVRDVKTSETFYMPLHFCPWCAKNLRDGRSANIPLTYPKT
jgi:hypothetical protein